MLASLRSPVLLIALCLPALSQPVRAQQGPHPAEAAGDEALEELAGGRPQAAVRRLRAALSREADEGRRHALRCALGQAERRAGDEAAAVRTLEGVPLAAACGPRAAFDRADALLALGRADEAAALYEQAGASALGEGRDAATAALLRRLGDKLLADPEADPSRAHALLALGLELALTDPDRLALARALGAQVQAARRDGRAYDDGAGQAAGEVSLDHLAGDAARSPDEEAELRRLAALLLRGAVGEGLLAPLPETPDTRRARAELALESDPARGLALLAQAVDLDPQDRESRATLARALTAQARLAEARPHWRELAQGDGADRPASQDLLRAEAALALARLEARLDPPAAEPLLAEWLSTFPAHPERARVEAELADLRLHLARRQAPADPLGAMARFDAFVVAHPTDPRVPEAAWEAGLAALAGGEPDAARARWEELMARHPDAAAADRAVEAVARQRAGDDLEAALAWLRPLRDGGGSLSGAAASALATLQEPALAVEVQGRQDPRRPTVRVYSRNLAELTVRLHRVEAEAFLRAGGRPDTLPDLDVAVIAPDREWTVTLPEAAAGQDRVTDLPLRVPGPGLYAVTVATPQREAQAIVLVSENRLITRARGGDLVVAALRGEEGADRPAGGLRAWVAHGGTVTEGRLGADGLARLAVPDGEAVVLVDGAGGPALAALSWGPAAEEDDALRVSAEVDRPVYLPGDRVGFRLVGVRGQTPASGAWTVQVRAGGVDHPGVTVRADARGVAAGELDLPLWDAGGNAWQLVARAPGEEDAVVLASLPVAGQAAPRRSVEVTQAGEGATVQVREADGRPAPGVPVSWTRRAGDEPQVSWTDAVGRVEVASPGAGLPWRLEARLAGGQVQAWAPDPAPLAPLSAHLDQDRPEAGQPLRLRVEGPAGPVRVGLFPVVEAAPPALPLRAPWALDLDPGLEGPRAWEGAEPGGPAVDALGEPRWLDLTLPPGAPVEQALEPLAAGRWVIQVVPAGPEAGTVRLPVEVAAAGPRLGALPAWLAGGGRLDLPVQGAALVTAEGEGIEAAALVTGTGRLRLDLPRAGERLALVATDGQARVHARTIPLRTALQVDLSVEEVDGRWRVQATVTGPDGLPARAQVALSAVDRRLLRTWALPALSAQRLWPTEGTADGAAVAGELRHAAWSQAISAALLAESARQEEARRAASAGRGRLSEGIMDELLLEEELGGLGYLGTRGAGGGGSGYGTGYGRGGGSFGAVSGKRVVLPFGWRDRVLWQVVESDEQGRVTVELDRPPPATWRLRATAVARGATGMVERDRASTDGVFLVAAPLAAAGAGERARPVAQVVNGGAAPFAGRLVVGDRTLSLSLEPGAQQEIALGELAPGQSLDLRVESADGAVQDQAVVALPVATGQPSAEGELLRVAVGPGGGLPLRALALEEDPAAPFDVGRAARAGRAALAGDRADPELARRVAQALAAVRLAGARAEDARAQAEVVALLVQAGPAAAVSRGEVDAALSRLEDLCVDSRDRVAQAWALALAGRPVDETRLGRLLRDAPTLDDEASSWLARALVLLGRPAEAAALVRGEGVHARLARQALGQAEGALPPLPPVGDPDRADWLQAARGPAGRARGEAIVQVDGAVLGRLDLATGGELRAVVPPGAAVVVQGAPQALVQRGTVPAGAVPLRAVRLPAGVDGEPVAAELPLAASCGAQDAPCALAPGDALRLSHVEQPGHRLSGGLSWQEGELRATQPGLYRVSGLSTWTDEGEQPAAPLWVEVSATVEAPLDQAAALALAEQAAAAGSDPLPLLAAWPSFDDWRTDLRPRALDLRFRAALDRGQGVVPAFEALRDGAPHAALALPDVAAVARAYAADGRPGRAVDAWRAGLGAAFLAEAAPTRRLEERGGRLVSMKAMRDLALRYPAVPVVQEALFHLPERLAAMVEQGVPVELSREGVGATDVRLLAAAWDREFLAWHPDSPLAPQAGFHLVQGLLRLRAFEAAATWADRVADAAPDDPVLDGLRFVEGLARSEQGAHAAARAALEAVAMGQWPQADGSRGPAGLRGDARFALGRLAEARGDLEQARRHYEEVQADFPEAALALRALTAVRLEPAPLQVWGAGQALSLPTEVANVDTVHLRAYRLDLRTVFLRDGGLAGASSVQVSGVSPAWSGRLSVREDPFPRTEELRLPMAGVGAWLVQVDAEGVERTSLVVRSGLTLSTDDGGDARRLVVRRGDRPAAGVEVRALDGAGQVVATRTDLRGVATVPTGARVLVFEGDDVAFSDPDEVSSSRGGWSSDPDRPAQGDLLRNLDRRIMQQRQDNEADYEDQFRPAKAAEIDASML